MNALRFLGILLILVGALGLAYGGFRYTKTTHDAKLGPVEISLKDKGTVNIPIWFGGGAIAIGAILLLAL